MSGVFTSLDRIAEYKKIAQKIAEYLSSKQTLEGTYPENVNYGYTFSALLWLYVDKHRFKSNILRAVEAYNMQDKKDSNFHWEFNNYALLKIRKISPEVISSVPWKKNKGTRSTNWILLRFVNYCLATGRSPGLWRFIPIMFTRFEKTGFIKDEFFWGAKVKSFQYHCFSASLLGELFLLTGKPFFKTLFLKGVEYMVDKIMPNGRAIYMGRGQEQIFGYGRLLYSLELAAKLTENSIFETLAGKVLSFLKKFQRKDGSFPLVLNEQELLQPSSFKKVNGWYKYNTLYDYLPFLGVSLMETSFIWEALNIKNRKKKYFSTPAVKKDPRLVVKTLLDCKMCYAVPTSGKGYYSDELPVPFIVLRNGVEITPIYGGDPMNFPVIGPQCVPLPYGLVIFDKVSWFFKFAFYYNLKLSHWGYKVFHKNFYEKFKTMPYFFVNQLKYRKLINGFIGKNPWIAYKRLFFFQGRVVKIIDIINFRKIFFEEFYPVNFFSLYKFRIKNFKKNSIDLVYKQFRIIIEGIKGKLRVESAPSPFGDLLWVREVLNKGQILKNMQRQYTIILD